MSLHSDDEHARSFLRGLEDGTKSIPGMPDSAPLRGMVHSASGGSGGYGADFLRRFLPGSDYDYAAQAGDLWKNSAIAACLRVYKSNFPQPEMEVRRIKGKGRDQIVPRHPLVKLFLRPNDGYDRYALWSSFCTAALCDGNAYLLKIRSRAKIPVQLWWVPPWMLRPVWPTDGSSYVSAYQYMVNGRIFLVPPEDVVHYRHGGPDPRYERLAMSELKAASARTVCGLNEVDGYTASIMRNMGIVPFVIEPAFEGGKILREDAETIRAQWRERTTGEKRGEPFINPGAFKVTQLGLSPDAMAMDKIPARLEDQIAGLMGVPAMLAGLTSGAQHKTYANWGEARRSFYEDTLIPMQAAVAECLEHNLLDDPGIGDSTTQNVIFSYDRILCLREDQDAIYTRATTAYEKRIIKRSEARDMIGLEWEPSDDAYAPSPQPDLPGGGIDPATEEGIGNIAEVVTKEDEDEGDKKAYQEGEKRHPFPVAWRADQR